MPFALVGYHRTDFLDLRIAFFQPVGHRDSRTQHLLVADSINPLVILLLLVDIQLPFHIHRDQDHEHQRDGESEDVDRRVPFVPAKEFQERFYI